MDPEMISKKELLEKTGISYGQLYRWKRKGLLPEEWFVKKSAFTGQETFFPAGKVLERIAKIRELKEETSLDELAGRLSDFADRQMPDNGELVSRRIVTEKTLEWLEAAGSRNGFPGRTGLLLLVVMERLFAQGNTDDHEAQTVLELLASNRDLLLREDFGLIFGRLDGKPVVVITEHPTTAAFGGKVAVAVRISFGDAAEELKVKLM
jgi:DNA-binding transcriptional MerR regulator